MIVVVVMGVDVRMVAVGLVVVVGALVRVVEVTAG